MVASARVDYGGLAMMGKHLIKSWSTTQTVVALSSGEAEYYGVAKGACEGIGLVGLVEDLLGIRLKIKLSTDSSAAKGIATIMGARPSRTRTHYYREC